MIRKSKNGRSQTVSVFWNKICATFSAVALTGSCVVLTAQPYRAGSLIGLGSSSGSPTVLVPDVALTLPKSLVRVPAVPQADPPSVAGAPGLSASAPPVVAVTGSAAPVALSGSGIPVRALQAYRLAASLVGSADPSCHLDWALVAAIGRVESNHARFGGNHLDAAGVARPGIIGIPLDGSKGAARITDTDGGLLDRDTTYDRAVGPMQFIPGTWRSVGTDADGDGVKNPQDMNDAATSTAIYLCSGPGSVDQPGDLHAAIMRYNPSESYVQMVTGIADTYRHGVHSLPTSDVAASAQTAADPTDANLTDASLADRSAAPSTSDPVSRPAAPVAPGATPPGRPRPPRRPSGTHRPAVPTVAPVTPSHPLTRPPATTPPAPTRPKARNPALTSPTPNVPSRNVSSPSAPSPSVLATVPPVTVLTPTVPPVTVPTLPVPPATVPTPTNPPVPCVPDVAVPDPSAASAPLPTSTSTGSPTPTPTGSSETAPTPVICTPTPTPTAPVAVSTQGSGSL